jgi:hypothetical protein
LLKAHANPIATSPNRSTKTLMPEGRSFASTSNDCQVACCHSPVHTLSRATSMLSGQNWSPESAMHHLGSKTSTGIQHGVVLSCQVKSQHCHCCTCAANMSWSRRKLQVWLYLLLLPHDNKDDAQQWEVTAGHNGRTAIC